MDSLLAFDEELGASFAFLFRCFCFCFSYFLVFMSLVFVSTAFKSLLFSILYNNECYGVQELGNEIESPCNQYT